MTRSSRWHQLLSRLRRLESGAEFLYGRNRLNVAISRAQCLAVVVASPKLLEAPCNTIEKMKLVNTLCFVKAYSQGRA
jgi:uncharacterized protein